MAESFSSSLVSTEAETALVTFSVNVLVKVSSCSIHVRLEVLERKSSHRESASVGETAVNDEKAGDIEADVRIRQLPRRGGFKRTLEVDTAVDVESDKLTDEGVDLRWCSDGVEISKLST
jgi:hypothetical protein